MEGYINVLEGSRPMLGCPIGYMEGSMAHAGVPGEVYGRHLPVQGYAGVPGGVHMH
jgi:hypothetical protein